MHTNEPIIELEHVSFSYTDHEVVSDVTLSIPSCDYLGVIGPNGAGKSTLLKLILGLLPLSTGHIRLFGKDIRDFKQWPLIGYVPQKVTAIEQSFPVNVYEVVQMGRYATKGLFRRLTADDARSIRQALEWVGMWELKHRLIGDLSGGQQQRVFIARALAGQPQIIFLDEPTVGVDLQTQNEFYQILQKVNRDSSTTLVLISHDIDTILRESQHIAYIDKTIHFYGTPHDFESSDLGKQLSIISRWHHH